MKMTRHNGRTGKHGTYNPKHNDRRFDIENSEHIDQERAKKNVYWDYYQGFHFPADQEQEGKMVYSFEQIERIYYFDHYAEFCNGQHERNRKTGHSNRDRTPEDLLKDKKTCPEETLIQIGTMERSVAPEVLAEIAAEFFEEFERRFGERIHILDWSLHLDEATPHIHERHVFDCENRYGEIAPQQEKALEALGFDLPDPNQKPGKMNNRKMTFDAACRAMLFDICESRGLHLDHEPEYGGRKYLEKQDYILMKQKEKIAAQDVEIGAKKEELDALTIRIEDTETFVDEIADVAYEKAVEAVTETVQEETRNEDFDLIVRHRDAVISDPRLSNSERSFVGKLFGALMEKFKGFTQHIGEKLSALLRDPEKKERMKEPIKRSIHERLADAQRQADSYNSGRRRDQKKKNRDMEL